MSGTVENVDGVSLLGPESRQQLALAARFGGAGLELLAGVLIGYFGGRWLDQTLNTSPWLQWALVGLLATTGLGRFTHLIRVTKRELGHEDNSPDK